jgi:hypothetical protein
VSAGNTFENDIAKLLFQNVDIALIGDAGGLRGSVAAGSLYIALHSSDPGEGGDQTTNEVAYTAYARVAVARTAGGWTVVGSVVSNAALISFPTCAGGSASATHFSIGVAGTLAGKILVKGELDPAIAISNGVTPSINAGELIGTVD